MADTGWVVIVEITVGNRVENPESDKEEILMKKYVLTDMIY